MGEANSVAGMEQMRARIGYNWCTPIGNGEHPVIGCIFVRDVRFFSQDAAGEPSSVRPQHRLGQRCDLADQSFAPYFQVLL